MTRRAMMKLPSLYAVPPRPKFSTGDVAGRGLSPGQKLVALLLGKVIGQDHAIIQILPYVQMYRAGLAPEGRPAGVFLLLGPTGTGKTKTVEALAEALHGSEKSMLKVDCGEFQVEHEVAKLIGSPPGYLGHRETQPLLTQQKLNGITSDRATGGLDLSLVLFDEIEKAAPSVTRLLLGVLDKAVLRLGDNTSVNFERSMIFLTSNLGSESMQQQLLNEFGFAKFTESSVIALNRLASIGTAAVKRKFSPEFVNRIDGIITYQPLSNESLGIILDQQLEVLQKHLDKRLKERTVSVSISEDAKVWLLTKGTSLTYGARELKRLITRRITQPIAALIDEESVFPAGIVEVSVENDELMVRPQTNASTDQ